MFDVSIRVNVDDLLDLDEVEVLRSKIATFLVSEPREKLLGPDGQVRTSPGPG